MQQAQVKEKNADGIEDSGQALLEFVVSSVMCATAIIGTMVVFRDQWIASKCAYLIFELTHDELTGRPPSHLNSAVQISNQGEWIRGRGRFECEKLSHPVELHKLENIEW